MSKGDKHDKDKIDWTLLPFAALKPVVRVLMFGEKKYSRDNWQLVKPNDRYLKAAFRHLVAYATGEKTDSETGESHLAHCVCCLLFLIWFDQKRTEK